MKRKIVILLLFILSNYCCACCACCDCFNLNDPNTPKYVIVTLRNVQLMNGWCHNSGDCIITYAVEPGDPNWTINQSYKLKWIEPDADHPYCRWIGMSDYVLFSIKSRGNAAPYRPGGIKLTVTKDPSSGQLSLVIDTNSSCDPGYALFFNATNITPEPNHCADACDIPNNLIDCYCDVWYDIPPWTAAVGGQAFITGLKNIDAIKPVDFQVLAELADQWLSFYNFYDLENLCSRWLK